MSEDSRCWYSGCACESYDKKVKWKSFTQQQKKVPQRLLALPNKISSKDIRQVAIGRSQALRRETALSPRGGRLFEDPTHAASRAAE